MKKKAVIFLAEDAGGGYPYLFIVCDVYIYRGMSAGAFDTQKICAEGEFADKAVDKRAAFGASVGNMCLKICNHLILK